MTILGADPPQQHPETAIGASFSVFRTTFQGVLEQEAGACFHEVRSEIATNLGWEQPSLAIKNVEVMSQTISKLTSEAVNLATLQKAAQAVVDFSQ